MKIVKNAIDKKKRNGYVVVMPIDEEDIWYVYNILMNGDVLRIKTMRKVLHQKGGEFSVKSNQRKLIKMTVKILDIKFEADEKGTSLMLKTRNLTDNEYVMKGQIQTIEVSLLQKLQIFKDHWDHHSEMILEESTDLSHNVDSVVVLLDEGYSAFYTIKRNFIKLHGKMTKSMPKKKTNIMDIYKKKVEEFDSAVWRYLVESFPNWDTIKAIVLAGPGNVRSRIFDKLKTIEQHEKSEGIRKIIKINLYKFACIQTSSTFKSSISEIMKDKTGAKLLEDTKAVKEVKKLEEFYEVFMKDSSLAVFGENEVKFAFDNNAIKSLLITDGLLRSKNFILRKKMSKFVEEIKQQGAEIFMFNETHESGARLKDITGIAAILRFPLDIDKFREDESNQKGNDDGFKQPESESEEFDEDRFDQGSIFSDD